MLVMIVVCRITESNVVEGSPVYGDALDYPLEFLDPREGGLGLKQGGVAHAFVEGGIGHGSQAHRLLLSIDLNR